MKRNFVSRVMWTQGGPASGSDTCMIKGIAFDVNDHRCDAYHNTSDAKVRIDLWNKYGIIKNAHLTLSFSSAIYFSYHFMVVRRALYTLPWVLVVVL